MKSKLKWLLGFAGAMIMAWLGNYFYDSTKDIPVLKLVTGALNWLFDIGLIILNYPIKVWTILTILLCTASLLALYGKLKNSSIIPPPDFTKYKKDVFKSWIWRWEWKPSPQGWMVTHLIPYCPKDDVQLINDSTMFEAKFYCPKCKTAYGEYYEPVEFAIDTKVLISDKVTKNVYPKS